MVSASALAKRPDRLIAAAVATDFLSSERRVVVMAFLPDFTAFAADILGWASVFGEPVGKSTSVAGDGGTDVSSRGSFRVASLAPERARQRRYLPVNTPIRIGVAVGPGVRTESFDDHPIRLSVVAEGQRNA